jgi:hypothetical protein
MKPLLHFFFFLIIAQLSHTQPLVPEARSGHRMAFDEVHGVVLLFGGWSATNGYLGDTWAWNGRQWRRIDVEGPSPRSWYGMATDVGQRRIYLFGGRDSSRTSLSDMWEWDGNRWKEIQLSHGPGARDHCAMAYDQVRRRVVLHGGYNVGRNLDYTDMWEWDSQAWLQRSKSGPPARSAHVMGFDEERGRVVMFGGTDSSQTVFGDTWVWEGDEWRLLPTGVVEGRTHTSLISAGTQLLRFGGKNEARTPFGDTWVLNGTAWERIDVAGPPARIDHAVAYDPTRERMVLFGGKLPNPSKVLFQDTWEWDGRRWTQR